MTMTGMDILASAQDGKFVRIDGVGRIAEKPVPDSIALIDGAALPPKVLRIVPGVAQTIQGPPQAVAITPDAATVIVGAPSWLDPQTGKQAFGTFLTIVHLNAPGEEVFERMDVGAHTNGVAIHPDGRMALAAGHDGTVKVVSIVPGSVSFLGSIEVSRTRLSSVSFTHDGRAALVGLRDNGGLAVLDVVGGEVKHSGEHVATGVSPFSIDVSSCGRWAVAGNVGVAGTQGVLGRGVGDVDTVTLVDVSTRPFRARAHFQVPATPEGVAISPDGNWIAVQSMAGSNLPLDAAGYRPRGIVTLFRNADGHVSEVNALPSGSGAQGIVFCRDNKTILVQFHAEKQIAVFAIEKDRLTDTGERLSFDAGPVSIRPMPR